MPIEAYRQFPPGFLWGCATAAHQVEGQSVNDWSRWEQTPGHIFQNQKAGLACDWWGGRFIEDFDRAAEMHNNAHRLSIEWSRIEPEPNQWDEYALDRYRQMLTALRERDIAPMVTLHHFSSPLWVGDHNGWAWDELPTYFERFARKVVRALGDLCTLWCTINEPAVYLLRGFSEGIWPPGLKSRKEVNRVTVNLLRGHAAAYHAIKELQPGAQVGFATHHIGFIPASPRFINRVAVRVAEQFTNCTFLQATDDGIVRLIGARSVPLPQVKGTLDWVGLQYYHEFAVGFNSLAPAKLFICLRNPPQLPAGPKTWGGLNPEAIFKHICWLATTFKKPIYITESGVPDPSDTIRPGYLIRTVHAIGQAININMPVRGFYFWSLLDNFEWSEGYDPLYNFGLYKTDFVTQERTARQSAYLYGEICAQNGLSAQTVARYAPDLVNRLFPDDEKLEKDNVLTIRNDRSDCAHLS